MVKTVRNALLFRMRNFRSRKTALFLVVTILVSVFAVNGDRESVYAAQKNAVYQKYSTKIDNRIKKIQNHQTDIQTVGTVFYISSSTGNDQNDGLSPETAWKTCAKMNEDADGVIHDSVEKYGGATVLFKRGDVWKRDGISLWYPNMIYSTYGTGEKPVFDFSLADAADPSMWKLKKGTKNIWIYQDKVPFLGSLTLNDRYSADNHDAYYDYKTKKWYECCPNGHYDQKTEKVCCNYKQKKYVNVNKLPENSFFVDVRPSKKWLDKESSNMIVYDCDEVGTLYFSCKKGNPGKVYKSIQLCQGGGLFCGNSCTYDDLVVKNTGGQAFSNFVENEYACKGCTLQNCEVYFCGDSYSDFNSSEHIGTVGGECASFHGGSSRYYNNYFYGSREGGITVEVGDPLSNKKLKVGDIIIEGNVFDACDAGIGVICFSEKGKNIDFSDITIHDNFFRNIGYAHDADGNDVHPLGLLGFWDHSAQVKMDRVSFTNNLILFAEDKVINLEETNRKNYLVTKNNVAILKKNAGNHLRRVTDRKYQETYYDSVKKAKPYIGSFGTVKWVD